jgi:hypothetical protein
MMGRLRDHLPLGRNLRGVETDRFFGMLQLWISRLNFEQN